MASEVQGAEELRRFILGLQPEVRNKVKRVLNAGGSAIQRQARKNLVLNQSNDQGELTNSIITTNAFKKDNLSVEVGPTAKHGPFIEFGTEPHFPPLLPLKRWAERHGIENPDSFARNLSNKIGWRGTEEKPYLIPAFNKIGPKVIKELKKALRSL